MLNADMKRESEMLKSDFNAEESLQDSDFRKYMEALYIYHSLMPSFEKVDLTAREFDLLLHFSQHPGRVFSRAQLLDSVWGFGHEGYEHTVNSHINRLRGKIEPDNTHPRYIVTVWGVGYKMEPAPAGSPS